jgi:CheY-like chemotaxis protein
MSSKTILVVEDNQDVLRVLSLLLGQAGFDVITAERCSAAYDYIMTARPDVILVDLMLPGMTGLEFIRLVRRMSDVENIPMVAMSAYDRHYLSAAIIAGANAAIHKPEDLDVLVRTIEQVLGGNTSHGLAAVR